MALYYVLDIITNRMSWLNVVAIASKSGQNYVYLYIFIQGVP